MLQEYNRRTHSTRHVQSTVVHIDCTTLYNVHIGSATGGGRDALTHRVHYFQLPDNRNGIIIALRPRHYKYAPGKN